MPLASRVLVGSSAVAVAIAVAFFRVPSASGPEARAGETPVPVLVELFTSEGCSSCPPAEDELSRLEAAQPVAGARIVTLGYHVDYWNGIGWPDPYSSATWTARQGEYDGDGRLYTPQAVVNGQRECVGSDDAALKRLVRDAASQPRARISVGAVPGSMQGATVRVYAQVYELPPGVAEDQAEVWFALVERGVVNQVLGGENAGKLLHHAPVVRGRAIAGTVGAAGGRLETTLSIPAGARRDHLDVVAVAQSKRQRRVVGVGLGSLDAP